MDQWTDTRAAGIVRHAECPHLGRGKWASEVVLRGPLEGTHLPTLSLSGGVWGFSCGGYRSHLILSNHPNVLRGWSAPFRTDVSCTFQLAPPHDQIVWGAGGCLMQCEQSITKSQERRVRGAQGDNETLCRYIEEVKRAWDVLHTTHSYFPKHQCVGEERGRRPVETTKPPSLLGRCWLCCSAWLGIDTKAPTPKQSATAVTNG